MNACKYLCSCGADSQINYQGETLCFVCYYDKLLQQELPLQLKKHIEFMRDYWKGNINDKTKFY